MAKMPTFAAWAYKNAMGHPVNYPDNRLDYCARFLKMVFAFPAEEYEVDPVIVDALDKLLILRSRQVSTLFGDLFTEVPTRK
jgi:citrate synthase